MRIIKKRKPLCVIEDQIIFGRINALYTAKLEDLTLNYLVRFPYPLHKIIFSYSKLLTRMLRLGFIACQVMNGKVFVVFNKRLYLFDCSTRTLNEEFKFNKGKGPLNLTVVSDLSGFDDGLYFGEYYNNPSKNPIDIVRRTSGGKYEVVFRFKKGEINHVHNIIPDKIRNCVWVLAGDFGESAGIWCTYDNFNSLERICFNSQHFRACVAFPVKEGLLYATDSQFEQNSIRLMNREADVWRSREVCKINGSSIYGCKVNGKFVFSTSSEPGGARYKNKYLNLLETKRGPGIIENESHILVGSLEDGFKVIKNNKKDILPYRLFQFGTVFFPSGDNVSNKLFSYSVANKEYDQDTVVYEI